MEEYQREQIKSRLTYMANQVKRQQLKIVDLHTSPDTGEVELGLAYHRLYIYQSAVDDQIRKARDEA